VAPVDAPRRIVAAVHRRDGRNADLVHSLIGLMEAHALRAISQASQTAL
jgi:hypothetical protein